MGDDDRDIKKDFQSFWKQTIDQLDDVRDVVLRSSQAGLKKLDETLDVARLKRQRDQALMELGRLVLLELNAAAENNDSALKDSPAPWIAQAEEIRRLEKMLGTADPEAAKAAGADGNKADSD